MHNHDFFRSIRKRKLQLYFHFLNKDIGWMLGYLDYHPTLSHKKRGKTKSGRNTKKSSSRVVSRAINIFMRYRLESMECGWRTHQLGIMVHCFTENYEKHCEYFRIKYR